MNLCPCGSNKKFKECCEPMLNGNIHALTAEQLMRSRYCAFFTKNIDYLVDTHFHKTSPYNLKEELQKSINSTNWIRLELLQVTAGSENDSEGFVRFSAHYNENGTLGTVNELSRFIKQNNRWYYTDGEHFN